MLLLLYYYNNNILIIHYYYCTIVNFSLYVSVFALYARCSCIMCVISSSCIDLLIMPLPFVIDFVLVYFAWYECCYICCMQAGEHSKVVGEDLSPSYLGASQHLCIPKWCPGCSSLFTCARDSPTRQGGLSLHIGPQDRDAQSEPWPAHSLGQRPHVQSPFSS